MFDSRSWDEGLDEAQLAVATHGDGPLVVLAGAGTGKTRALVSRLAFLLERGAPSERILLLTFTRRAADDMLTRAAALVGLDSKQRPRGGTFHAVAHRYLAANAESLGVAPSFGILDPSEASDLMDLMRGQHDLVGSAARFPRSTTLVEIYSRCINRNRPLHEVVQLEYPWCEPHLEAIAHLFRAFTTRKHEAGILDFDDLLLHWRAMLGDAALGAHRADQFDYVLVDEYQDVNTLQVDIVRLLAPSGRGLTVVGDEAQAIYGFRGADSRHLRKFVLDLPGASVVRLERSFRTRQAILDVANELRPHEAGAEVRLYSERTSGSQPRLLYCYDAASEARAIVDQILEAHERGIALRDQAVLVRAGHHSDLVEVELAARKVPYRKYGGIRFLEAAHVKDFVAAARLIDNAHDEIAWYRLLRLHQGIGPSRARGLIDTLHSVTGDALGQWQELVAAAPAASRGALSASLAGLMAARAQPTPARRAETVLDAIRPLLVERYADSAPRLADLERLVTSAAAVDSLGNWLADLTLDPPVSTGDLAGPPHREEDYVVISTIHSAKGLEWSVVHIPHVVDGMIPIDMALSTGEGLEEERRLFYVAVTRSRDELHLYSPLRLPHHRRASDDRHSYAQLSRFVDQRVIRRLKVEEQAPRSSSVSTQNVRRIAIDLDSLWSTSSPRSN